MHEKLPTRDELRKYKSSLRRMRGLPKALKGALERVPKRAHPMDVLRTGVSVLGTIEPEKDDHGKAGAQRIADRLMASTGLDPSLLVPLQPPRQAHRNRDRR